MMNTASLSGLRHNLSSLSAIAVCWACPTLLKCRDINTSASFDKNTAAITYPKNTR
jgi:hypothetical protein